MLEAAKTQKLREGTAGTNDRCHFSSTFLLVVSGATKPGIDSIEGFSFHLLVQTVLILLV